jgi:hypothetical protein
MVSATSLLIFGVIALVAVVVIWKWWKKPDSSKKNEELTTTMDTQYQIVDEDNTGPPKEVSQPPPMVFAVNDNGFLDLSDMSGKILNIGFGPHPKTYVNLLDQAEKDTDKHETDMGVRFISKVGYTKLYEVAGRPYIINYTRL